MGLSFRSRQSSAIKVFDNGIRVFDRYLIDEQRMRYANVNLHEPVEERWIIDLCHRTTTGSFRFWDVGAGIGYYSLLVARHFPSSIIEAFEPLEYHADAIEHHLALNNIPKEKIVIHRTALGNITGNSKLIVQGFGTAIQTDDCASLSTIEVPIARIDDILSGSSARVDLLKVDVQGLELDVIEGARHSSYKIGCWVVGTHGSEVHAACHAALNALGYTVIFSEPRVDNQPDGLIVASRA